MNEQSQQAILNYLKMFATYDSGPGPIGRFTLNYGRFWTSAALPRGMKRGRPKGCFSNAFDLLKRGGGNVTYVEGHAISGTSQVPLPIHHAWLVDLDGNVIDNTWDQPEASTYFGVPFETEYVKAIWSRNKTAVSMLDNFEDRWSLVRGFVDANEAVADHPASIFEGITP